MRTIVAGGREFNDYALLDLTLSRMNVTEVVSGTARGADKCGELWAHNNNVPIHRCPARWKKYGKRAGFLRNEYMATQADVLVAFWDGKSKGTKHMIDTAGKQGLTTITVSYKGDNV